MKASKIIAASIIGAASIASVHATNVGTVTIKVTGSTAFRKAFYFATVKSLTGAHVAAAKVKTTDGVDTTTDWSGANRAVITGVVASGPLAGSTAVVQCAWAGSVGGVQVVTENIAQDLPGVTAFNKNQTWLASSNTDTTAVTVDEVNNKLLGFKEVGNGSPAFDAAAVPTAATSDSFQSSTIYTSPTLLEENAAGNGVGVVDFAWTKGTRPLSSVGATDSAYLASYNRLTNISALQASVLLGAGNLPLSFFTGNASDTGVDVLLVGRTNDSGTRLVTQAEAGFGFGQAVENQYSYPSNGGLVSVGDNGYSSGGSVRSDLARAQTAGELDENGKPFILVGYLSSADSSAISGQRITFNGVPYSTTAVASGAYSFWSYEHVYYRAGTSGNPKSLLDLISTQLRTVDAAKSGNLLTSMSVSRSVEGGTVAP